MDVGGLPRAGTAIQLSNLATTPEQARLWRQSADQGLATGLSTLERTDRPVQSRQPSTAPNQAIPAQGAGIPAGVVSAVRIISTAGLEESAAYDGPATVSDVSAERLSLNLGGNRIITLQARAGGRALLIMPGDTVRVDYRVRNERLNRRQILAIRALNGGGIARVTESGPSPVTVAVSLFGLVATQVSGPPYTSVDVRVGNGNARKTIVPGEIAQIGGMTVGLMASRAITGPEARTLEGSPYSIDLIAWPSR